ncbi:MAG: hypothetical protein F6K24_47265, partial [Okeania sp. SIO2D1]|nr:hypothetical protein [Okeania sp. SIO2D1]
MEVVLDLYSSQHSQSQPLICMNEAAIQLTGHLYKPIEMKPGQDAKEDYHYTRQGTQALFMFFDQKRGSQASPWLRRELPLYKGMKKRLRDGEVPSPYPINQDS